MVMLLLAPSFHELFFSSSELRPSFFKITLNVTLLDLGFLEILGAGRPFVLRPSAVTLLVVRFFSLVSELRFHSLAFSEQRSEIIAVTGEIQAKSIDLEFEILGLLISCTGSFLSFVFLLYSLGQPLTICIIEFLRYLVPSLPVITLSSKS